MGYFSDYKREERLKPGKHRVVVISAEEMLSRNNNPMITITLQPSGSDMKIKHRIVKNSYFNLNMTSFFDSFTEIPQANFNYLCWIGAVGAAELVKDENGYLVVREFLTPEEAASLPVWQGAKPERNVVVDNYGAESESLDDSDVPFF